MAQALERLFFRQLGAFASHRRQKRMADAMIEAEKTM
jgi:hypothetical protein